MYTYCTLILELHFCNIEYVHNREVQDMAKLKINKDNKGNDTITRTIRISGTTFDKITELAEKNNISFNSVVNQIIEFGLNNLYEEE